MFHRPRLYKAVEGETIFICYNNLVMDVESENPLDLRQRMVWWIALALFLLLLYLLFASFFHWWPWRSSLKNQKAITSPSPLESKRQTEVVVSSQPDQTPVDGLLESRDFMNEPMDQISLLFTNPLDEATISESTVHIIRADGETVSAVRSYDRNFKKITLVLAQTAYPPADGSVLRLTVAVQGLKDISGNAVPDFIYHLDLQK